MGDHMERMERGWGDHMGENESGWGDHMAGMERGGVTISLLTIHACKKFNV